MKQVTRSLISFGLLAAVGVGIGGYVLSQRDKVASGEGGQEERQKLDVDPLLVVRVQIEDRGHKTDLRLEATGWRVHGEVAISADPNKVRDLLRDLGRTFIEKSFSESDPAPTDTAAGLDTPSIFTAYTVDGPDAEPKEAVRLELGKSSEFNRQVYARVTYPGKEPSTVMLSSGSSRMLVKSASQLYDRRAIGADIEHVSYVKVTPVQPSEEALAFAVERDGDAWRLIEPAADLADRATVLRVLEGLGGAPVSSFVTLDAKGALGDFGLQTPAYIVTIKAKRGPDPQAPVDEHTLLVGQLRDDDGAGSVRVARRDQPWVGEAHEVIHTSMACTLDQLKDKRLVQVDREKVARVEMDLEKAGSVVLERTSVGHKGASTWKLVSPVEGAASAQAVNTLVLTFGSLLGARRVLEGEDAKAPALLARYGLDEKGAERIRLLDAGGAKLAELRLGKTEGEEAYAMAEGVPFAVAIAATKLQELPEDARELLE
jgi:hypothetical protein